MTIDDTCVIEGCYTTFKHIKTRKVVVLEVEVPEESFEEIITKLGMPIGGESKRVAVALLNKDGAQSYNESFNVGDTIRSDIPVLDDAKIIATCPEKTEGEKLRTRAVLLCKEKMFQNFIGACNEEAAKLHIYRTCGISSRSEIAKSWEAKRAFIGIDEGYKGWLFEQQHADNLKRI